MEPDAFELRRQLAKLQRAANEEGHPFERMRSRAGDQLVFDDEAATATVLITIAGSEGKLGIPPIEFFELIDRPVRRIFIKSLMVIYPPFYHPHPLGDSIEQVKETLRAKVAGHSNVVLFGPSIGGHLALMLGAFLNASTVITVNPTTTLVPGMRRAFGDYRAPEYIDSPTESFLRSYADLPTIWRSTPPKRVIAHYSYREHVWCKHAEHLAEFPQVKLVPHYEYQVINKITADGTLRRLLQDALDPTSQISAEAQYPNPQRRTAS